mmetsp:Transcript_51148/g.153674  ORF Transcript_51148/g.153674 Transcript_51148/m.153674 type:complete len:314 (-) Transcript_51148:188-1129(-)|eukprot:CAMPEP_0113532980 /NCGR_PEP_ID=MMETSP0015_2-20120614/4352_1 /TAXON_ID=2838 /ORGANISM="Odontella" /LENGTH=313 /DNA_ID=CAMNT_0000431985 /DNA_START=56 /DNA_END=997 /DNA_ORIENTATION=+ /assembly_acc=CAM_ASM_000160
MTSSSRRSSSSSVSDSSPDVAHAISGVESLRTALRPDFPEIDRLYSDEYIRSVLSVPGRTFEYARDKKIRGALEWRRSFGVEALRGTFRCDDDDGEGEGRFILDEGNAVGAGGGQVLEGFPGQEAGGVVRVTSQSKQSLDPSAELIELCLSGALRILSGGGGDKVRSSLDRRRWRRHLVLHARASLIDWWKSGVDAGLQYHVLVIEHALSVIRQSEGVIPESMTLLVDTVGIGAVPPPVGALRGMVGLLQRAYPDRIHQIVVFPVGRLLRRVYEMTSPMMAQRSREKIALVGSAEEAVCLEDSGEREASQQPS